MYSYIQVNYNIKKIDEKLIDCNNSITYDENNENNENNENDENDEKEYFLGIIVNNNQIVVPFYIYVLYAECYLLLKEDKIRLKLVNYCYYRKLILLEVVGDIILESNLSINNFIDIENVSIKLLSDVYYKISVSKEVFSLDRVDESKIYPFIFYKSQLNDIDINELKDEIIPGSYIYSNDQIIGIYYNISYEENILISIPLITIFNFINQPCLKNIFNFNYLNYKIIKINNKNILDNNKVLYDDIEISIFTYFYYIDDDEITILVNNNNYIYNKSNNNELNNIEYDNFFDSNNNFERILLKREKLLENINVKLSLYMNIRICKNNIFKYSEFNLLFYEWLRFNKIKVNCISLVNYKNNPFKLKLNKLIILDIINKNDYFLTNNNAKFYLEKYYNNNKEIYLLSTNIIRPTMILIDHLYNKIKLKWY